MFEQKGGIYKITNLINNKVYIGSSKNISVRITAHKNILRRNKHANPHLQSAYNKYKEFDYSVLEYCDETNLPFKEEYYINLYRSNNPIYGYNLDDFMRGRKNHSEETKLKIGIGNKGKRLGIKLSQEQIEGMIRVSSRPKSQQHKDNIAKCKLGKKRAPFSKEWLEKMSIAGSKYWNLYDTEGILLLKDVNTKTVANFIGITTVYVNQAYRENRIIKNKYLVKEVEHEK